MLKTFRLETPYLTILDGWQRKCTLDQFNMLSLQLIQRYFLRRFLQNILSYYMLFLMSNTFISNTRLKMEKNQANAKQHPQTEILLKENFSVSSFMLSSKTKIRYSKKCVKSKCVCFNKIM